MSSVRNTLSLYMADGKNRIHTSCLMIIPHIHIYIYLYIYIQYTYLIYMIFHVFFHTGIYNYIYIYILDDNPKQRLDDAFSAGNAFFWALGVGLFVHGSINYNQFYQHIPAFPQKIHHFHPFSCSVAC